MVSEHIFKIDEHHLGIEVNNKYNDEYRFPVEMLASGRKYNGIEATLNKPHGKKIIMDFVLKLLLKGPKQYTSLVNHALKKFTWLDLNDCLEILLLDGIIQITFKNLKPRKTVEWSPKTIQLDPRVMEYLIEEIPDYNLELTKLKDSVMALLNNNKSEMKEYLLKWIDEKEIKDSSGYVIAEYISFRKFKSIVLAVAYYVNLKTNGEKLPWRYLSNKILRHPRALISYKNEIALSAGITLDELDSVFLSDINGTLHAPLILISPIDELQKLLDKLLEPEIQKEKLFFLTNELNNLIQKIIQIIRDSPSNTFLLAYNAFSKEIIKGSSQEVRQSMLNGLKQSINALNKQMLKTEYIRQQFELIVLEEIGSGSFARVFKVFDPELKKIAACKVLFPKNYFKQVYGNDGDEYLLRFKREVRLLTKELRHKNIINVMKIQLEGSPFWFTMPLASFSLEKWIKDNRDASDDQRIKIFNEIISGVKYLHEKNKYHRDLAPNNILLYKTDYGLEVKIADFGLAKDPKSGSFHTGLSKRGYGREDFTDPHQLNNLADSNHLSDIYSLGALLYYLLSSKLPKKRFYVSVFCQSVIMKAMDKRERRYQTINEFENDLNIAVNIEIQKNSCTYYKNKSAKIYRDIR